MAGAPARSPRRPVLLWLALLQLLAGAAGWCCRACAKCMCASYGVCPPPPQPPRHDRHDARRIAAWNASSVAAFVRSLGPEGARQSCPAACPIVTLIAAAAPAFERIDGATLSNLLDTHSERLRAAGKNETARVAHAAWCVARGAALGVFPVPVKPDRAIAFFTRLHGAIHHQSAPHRQLLVVTAGSVELSAPTPRSMRAARHHHARRDALR